MKRNLSAVGFAVLMPFVGDALAQAPVNPDELRVPAMLTCIDLPAPMSFRAERGLMKVTWEWRLERGPYVSEREDAEGTFYRAPPGGAFAGRPDSLDKPSGPLTHRTSDGGFWIPRDPNAAPKLYAYFTTEDAVKVVPTENENCSSITVVKDPATSKVSTVSFAVAGAIGGAAGQATGRAINPNTALTAGQGIAGGALGGAIVAALINSGVGKIVYKPIDDPAFAAKLRELSKQAVAIKDGNAETVVAVKAAPVAAIAPPLAAPAPVSVPTKPGGREVAAVTLEAAPKIPVTPAAAPALAVAAPVSLPTTGVAPAPGMQWNYTFRDAIYRRTNDFSVSAKAVDDTKVSETMSLGGDEKTFSTSTRDIAFEKHMLSGELVIELSPYLLAQLPAPAMPLPQTPSGYPGDSSDWSIRVTDVRREPVSVPAGRFEAYRVTVVGENRKAPLPMTAGLAAAGNVALQRFEYTAWYSPEVGRYIQARHQTYGGQGQPIGDEWVQLKSFQLRQGSVRDN